MSDGDEQARGLVLLDRDGTINVERHYLSSPDQVELLPGAAEAIGLLRDRLGLRVAVVTNQSGLARGYFDEPTLERIHARVRALLADEGQDVDGFYFCPHHPDERCACRKPAAELAHRAAADLGAEVLYVVGDNVCDVELGQQVGATTILVRTGHGERVLAENGARPDHIADDLLAAARLIAADVEERRSAA